MKRILKLAFSIFIILLLVTLTALAYLNFVYLPRKVDSQGAAYLEQKSRGQVLAESIQYIPFKGVELKNITILSKTKQPILSLDKLYFSANLWTLLIRKDLDFRLALYPPKKKEPLLLSGLYQIKQQKLQMQLKAKTDLFIQKQTISGQLTASMGEEEKTAIDLKLSSPDLNAQGKFYISDKNLTIEKFSGKIAQSVFNFIGDVQNLSAPSLNIYGTLDLDLKGLQKLNPKYTKLPDKLDMTGRLAGEIYIASELNNPELGLKASASQIMIGPAKIDDLSIKAKMKDKKVSVAKLYARLYDGELSLEAEADLSSPTYPANLNLNIFNLDLHKITKDMAGKELPVHGRVFSLARLGGPLRDPKGVEGKIWLSASGSNILQLPILTGIADILRLPQLRKIEFKEAGGNFSVGQQQLRTSDFKISGNNVVIHYKGYIDFSGNLSFDIEPRFSQNFLTAPSISNIMGIFFDTTGNFLGEIKLKGTLKKARHTFKPFSTNKLFRGGIEKGLEQLFKFKKE